MTTEEKVTDWESQALQLRSERDQLAETCERLALTLAETERNLAQAKLGFHIPQAPENSEAYEPFSQ